MLDDAVGQKSPGDAGPAERLTQQDAILQRQMAAKRNLYRWGSKWVGRQQYEELKKLDEEIRRNVGQIEAQQQSLRSDVAQIDRQIADNNAYLRQLDQSRNYLDKNGKVVQGPLPPAYFEAQNRGANLLRERQSREAQAASLDGSIRQERARFPTPPYNGAVEPVGEDGVPVTLPPEPGQSAAPPPGSSSANSSGDDADLPEDPPLAGDPDPTTRPGG